jgi:RNA polymerase sigma-70 factor
MTTHFSETVDICETLRRAHLAARARWPEIELSLHQFSDHLQRLGWVSELPHQTEELYLCCACSLGIREACRRLEMEYFPDLAACLAIQCRRPDFVEEILQQTRERLLVGPKRKIASYRGAGTLAAWLRRVARHLASDLYRSEAKHRRLASAGSRYWLEGTDPGALAPDGWNQTDARHLGALERALLEATVQLSPSDRRLLHLHYVQGLSIDEIAPCLGRDRSNVYRRLSQIRARIKRWSVACARKHTGIRDRDELDGLFRANCMGIYLDPMVWIEAGRDEDDSPVALTLRRD